MFEKLLSLIPYNPGLLPQMSFYAQRMRQETSIRRLGMVFIVLAFLVQFFAVLNPPKPTVAEADNDLISGGINSRSDAVNYCQSNTHHYADVLAYYGITCSDVAGADTVTITSTGQDRQLYSMGRRAYGKAGETPVYIKGASYYWRYLWSWDTGGTSTYQALKLHSSADNKTYWILYSCGNLTTIGVPSPPLTPINPFPSVDVPYTPAPATPTPTPTPVAPTPAAPTPSTPSTPTPSTPSPCVYDSSLSSTDSRCVPCQYNSGIIASNPACKPCDASVSSADATACIKVRKQATNDTQALLNADGTTAQPGDVITYTLYADNSGKATVKNYIFQENIGDVLDYADVVDLHGGTLDGNKDIRWPATDIGAGSSAMVVVTVKVKNPIPQSPVSTSDPGHFDLTMTNVYGNAVNIKVPGSPAKTIEAASTALPNTGPGTSLFAGGCIVVIAGYFFARSRLLTKEAHLVTKLSAAGEL